MSLFSPAQVLLLIEDHTVLRQQLAHILMRQGCHVLQASSPSDALRISGGSEAVHLLLTDFSMAEGRGLDLSLEFLKLNPKTKVLSLSASELETVGGFAETDDLETG